MIARSPAVVAVATTGYASLLVFLRGRPSLDSDSGIFLSVAARLLHGDRLYSGVWDNKPPFFYYVDAVAVRLAGWRGPFLVDVFWLALATCSFWLLLRAVGASRLTAAVGYVVYPLFLTGTWYQAGYSELPALALAPLIPALWAGGAAMGAGAALGVAVLFRPDYTLIMLALLGTAMYLDHARGRPLRRAVVRLLVGFAATLALAVALVAARGELPGYVHAMVGNLGYPDRALKLGLGLPTGLRGHVDAIREILADGHYGLILILVSAVALGPVIVVLRRARSSRRSSFQAAIAGMLLAAAVTTAVTLSLTAVWFHHLEPLALPASLLTVLVVGALESVGSARFRIVAIPVVVVAALFGLGGRGDASPHSIRTLSEWWHTPTSFAAEALNEARARAYPGRPSVTWAHVGSNDEQGSAAFLRPGLRLACPVFDQYLYSANLHQTFDCLQHRLPDLVLVTSSFQPAPHDEEWNAFVRSTTALLQRRYVEAVSLLGDGERYVVWRTRAERGGSS